MTDDLGLDLPDFGSPHVVASLSGRVLHLRIDRVDRRNAFTQDMYRAIKRAAIWADEQPALDAIAHYPDNILYETDYPHPTCQHPGPRTPAQRPRDYATGALGSLPDDVLAKVLHDNAARVYGLA